MGRRPLVMGLRFSVVARLRSEDLQGRAGVNMRLIGSSLGSGAFQDSRADLVLLSNLNRAAA